ncbi:GQ67_05300T0 [Komagataella phaffii]|nr:GQ67_05300T0 [Komagataella phaffii]AOA69457.1 GQ68_05313T0 [Komagataella phaffii GS115]
MGFLLLSPVTPIYTSELFSLSCCHLPGLLLTFVEGVVVAKKDFEIQHEEIGTKNLYVIKALQSLTSKGYVKTQFSWQYYYYSLTDDGLEYLREYLNIPEGIVPKTLLQEPVPERLPRRGGERRFTRN